MLERLPQARADSLMALGRLMQAVPRPTKIDLGVGTYRDETGAVPIMAAVKAAERELLIAVCGLRSQTFAHLDAAGDLDGESLRAALDKAQAGDVVLLHGCCHNPAGVDLTPQDWTAVAAACVERGLTPLIDLAYPGLGEALRPTSGACAPCSTPARPPWSPCPAPRVSACIATARPC
jgi:aspartate/tyrosine/aromatic aminotransferase